MERIISRRRSNEKSKKAHKGTKKKIADAGLDWKNWLVVSESDEELVLYSKKSGRRRTVK